MPRSNCVYVLKCCFAMVPVLRNEDEHVNKQAHIAIKNHNSRSSHRRTGQPPPPTRMTLSQCSEEVSKFCEYHSRHAAYHLAHSIHLFIRDHNLHPTTSQSLFMDKFLEGFKTHFESGYRLAQTGATDELKCTDETCCKSDNKSNKMKEKFKHLFGKAQWNDPSGQPLCSTNIIKDGSLKLLTERQSDFHWQKIWLLLLQSESGNMLYIYTNKNGTPNKAVKCCQLKEARPTRSMGDPSLFKNAFVIKIQPTGTGGEYVLHAQSKRHRNDWVRHIRDTIPSDTPTVDDLSDSEGEEDGRSNTGFSSASTGSHSTSTSDSLEPPFDGPTHMDINEFHRPVSEEELLSSRRLPKPNSYSSLPQSNSKDSSWQRMKMRFNRSREGESQAPTSNSLPSSRSTSRHSYSRSNSPDCDMKQRSNSLRNESRNNVFMPSSSNSLPGHHNVLVRNRSLGSDNSLPSGTSSNHSSLGRVNSAPVSSHEVCVQSAINEVRLTERQQSSSSTTTTTTTNATTHHHITHHMGTTPTIITSNSIHNPVINRPQRSLYPHSTCSSGSSSSSTATNTTTSTASTTTDHHHHPAVDRATTYSQPARVLTPTRNNLAPSHSVPPPSRSPSHLAATFNNHTYTNIPPSSPRSSSSCSTPKTTTSDERDCSHTKLEDRHSLPSLKNDALIANNNKHDPYYTLFQMPWFHSPISRTEAVAHVQMGGGDHHGRFLIRKSDTKQGEFVLTFNNDGAAKHLRMKVTDAGCQIQHLTFDSVEKMIDHFKTHPIPLDNAEGSCRQVLLTDYIPSDLQDEGTPVPSMSTTFFPQNTPMTSEQQQQPSPLQRSAISSPNGTRNPPERPPRVYKGTTIV